MQPRNKVLQRHVKAERRADRTEPTHSNYVWAMDFVHDQLAKGHKISVLTVGDTFSHFSPAVDAHQFTRARTCFKRSNGYAGSSPASICVDNGNSSVLARSDWITDPEHDAVTRPSLRWRVISCSTI